MFHSLNAPCNSGAELQPDEFMNSKKSHEVQSMSEVVACLAKCCGVRQVRWHFIAAEERVLIWFKALLWLLSSLLTQVIDVGSGKGYLSSFLSLQYGLQVYGIDSSSINTHGAQERNRKLKKFSRSYQKRIKAVEAQREAEQSHQDTSEEKVGFSGDGGVLCGAEGEIMSEETEKDFSDVSSARPNPETEEMFLSALSLDVIETMPPRISPTQLSAEERERRKKENLEKKALNRTDGTSAVFSPLTSYVTAETELRELISELEVSSPYLKKHISTQI